MIGLLTKDLLLLRKQIGWFVALDFIYAALGYLQQDTMMIAGFVLLGVGTLPMTSLSFDKLAGWDHYALTMPLTRKQLVGSKYLLALLFCITGAALAAALSAGLAGILGASATAAAVRALTIVPIGLVFASVQVPMAVKGGVEKAQLAMLMLFLLPLLFFFLLLTAKGVLPQQLLQTVSARLYLIGPVAGALSLALFAGSYLLSVRFARQKEY